ncbi:MAG TPA: diacylglycerol kinase family protein [Nitrospiria bacterium]|jgi:YegS/Rv2252/BmrU family lipid kinase|nr:diacylglycerol kinase family protein [Nitrospiria bacterium]
MMAKKPTLILNPVAGPVWRRRKSRQLIDHLKTLFPDLTVHPTGRAGDGERLARMLSSGAHDLILAAGGDGTYHEVINGMRGSAVPLGILPMGTGNSLIREVGLPTNPIKAATAIRNGVVRPIYLGQIGPASNASGRGRLHPASPNQRLFILMVGAGFDASIVRSVPPGPKKLGMLAYMAAGIIQLFRYDYSTVTFRVDGREVKGTSGITAKARCYGGPFAIVPHVRLDRPELVLCLFKGRGPLTYMKYTLGVIAGLHHRMKDVEFHHGRSVEIESPVPLQADGEAVGTAPARLTIVPETLNLVFPGTPPASYRSSS